MNGPTFAPAPAQAPTTPARPAVVRQPIKVAPLAKPADDTAAVLRLLTYLRLHWLSILFLGSFLGAGLAYAAWNLLPAKFESTALLHVAQSPSYIAAQNDTTQGRADFITYMKTTAELLKSDFVLNAALNDAKYRIADLPTLTAQKDPIKYLIEKIQVGFSDGSQVIRVSMEGDKPEDLRKIVDAVKDAYYAEVIEREIKLKTAFKFDVEKALTLLEGRVKSKQGTKGDILAVAPGGIPAAMPAAVPDAMAPVPGAPGVALPGQPVPGVPPVQTESVKTFRAQHSLQRWVSLESAVRAYPIAIRERQTRIDLVKKQIEKLKTGEPSADALAAAEKDHDYLIAEAKAKKYRNEASAIRALLNNPMSQQVIDAQARAAAAEAAAEKIKMEKAHTLELARRQGNADKLTAMLDQMEQDLRNDQEREQIAKKQLEDVQKEVAEIQDPSKMKDPTKPLVDIQATDLITHDAMYAGLIRQQLALDFELKSPPRVRVLQPASTPREKDTRKQIIGTVFAGLMGFALVGFALIGYESSVRKVSSLGELKTSGSTPVVGVIPWAPGSAAMRDAGKRADVNEAIDKLRSYVAQTWLSRGATTVAVTSPVGDEGKAFAAFGLASSLAQAGYKTLLVDFDLRNPSLHMLAGVENGVGVCEMLRGQAEARSTVIGLPSGLWFLPAGRWSDEARQAAVGGRLEALLTKLKEPFDCVILHGHALLTVAESVEVARRSEVVLLCSLYRDTRLPMLKRAADRVAAMEVPYSGVVYLGATGEEALC